MLEVYKQDGIKMAAVASFPDEAWTTTGEHDSEIADLAKKVAWLYAVHRKRAGATSGLPIELQQNGEKVDKYVTEEFLRYTVYGCHVVVTNPTSSRQKLDILVQIPKGPI